MKIGDRVRFKQDDARNPAALREVGDNDGLVIYVCPCGDNEVDLLFYIPAFYFADIHIDRLEMVEH